MDPKRCRSRRGRHGAARRRWPVGEHATYDRFAGSPATRDVARATAPRPRPRRREPEESAAELGAPVLAPAPRRRFVVALGLLSRGERNTRIHGWDFWRRRTRRANCGAASARATRRMDDRVVSVLPVPLETARRPPPALAARPPDSWVVSSWGVRPASLPRGSVRGAPSKRWLKYGRRRRRARVRTQLSAAMVQVRPNSRALQAARAQVAVELAGQSRIPRASTAPSRRFANRPPRFRRNSSRRSPRGGALTRRSAASSSRPCGGGGERGDHPRAVAVARTPRWPPIKRSGARFPSANSPPGHFDSPTETSRLPRPNPQNGKVSLSTRLVRRRSGLLLAADAGAPIPGTARPPGASEERRFPSTDGNAWTARFTSHNVDV